MNNNNLVITIGREYGSGGTEIGVYLAEKLHINCYDHDLIDAQMHNRKFLDNKNTRPMASLLYSIVRNNQQFEGPDNVKDLSHSQKAFLAQFGTIRDLATKDSCVVVGRCADFVLNDCPKCCKFFIHATIDYRLQRVKSDVNISDNTMLIDYIRKKDMQRSNYYNYYTGKNWGDSRNYDLTLNSSILGSEGAAKVILAYLQTRFPDTTNELLNKED